MKPVKWLWDALKEEICSINVQMANISNLQQLCDAREIIIKMSNMDYNFEGMLPTSEKPVPQQ